MAAHDHILSLESRLLEAIKTSDVATIDALLHDDLLFIIPNGETITKEMDLASHRAGAMIVEKIIPTIGQVNLIGDTAVVTLAYETKGKMLGQPVEGKFRYIRVWKQCGEDWKVIAGSCAVVQGT